MKLLALLVAATAAVLPAVRAAEPIHVFIRGQVSGELRGDNPEDRSVNALAFEHSLISPRDAASGLPTGKRQHKPLTIVKAIDRATPLLYHMLVTNENLQTVELKFYRPDPRGGQPVHYYTIKLENASIASIRNWKPNTRDLSADRAGDLEEVSFTYQKITWTLVEGNISATDDWEASNI
jgi:type VI secretion system secreted protein Hcp